MKKFLLTIITAGLFTSLMIAQSVPGFSYQAVARDAQGEIISNQQVGIEIGILGGSVDGSMLYTEEFFPTTNSYGLINLTIGTGSATLGSFSEIDWSLGSYFVKVSLDVEGGQAFEEIATSQLLSVPYAMYAQTAENVAGIDVEEIETLKKDVKDLRTQLKSSGMVMMGSGTFIDERDQQIYKYVETEDGETWMGDNLKAEVYTDSSAITGVFDYNGDPSISEEYGKLYTYEAISAEGKSICPEGYHMPSCEEWQVLIAKYGGEAFAAGKMKEAGTDHWNASEGVTDEAETGILPAGGITSNGVSSNLGSRAYVWSGETCAGNANYAVAYQFSAEHNIVIKVNMKKDTGLSVRCIKD